jgi:hypothetical protein
MVQTNTRNNFLLDLLDLQQDGKYAISAPSNWIKPPLLEVTTEIDGIVSELGETLLRGENNDTARWYFFIGSPGNGKSAAIGKLCRTLNIDKGCKLFDETGNPITSLDPKSIPYAIDVHEGSNRFASAKIVQDASVVRNPFASNVDPSRDLLDTLALAWEKGISLVVCTNRGVLEKAHRDNHTVHGINRQPWFKVIKALVKATIPSGQIGNVCSFKDNGHRKLVFDNLKIGYTHLDNRSLIRGENTFDSLIENAILDKHWLPCKDCEVAGMCPFKVNRDWLRDDTARERILQLLKRAEILSGQVIVFREALAIISLVLAGCPRDYNNHHPCDWVYSMVNSGNIFSLANRRIYMSLFTPYSPHGLDSSGKLRGKQVEYLGNLLSVVGECSSTTKVALEHVINGPSPSTDVGVTRLLGENKTIANLDPWSDDLDSTFYDNWDSDYDNIPADTGPFVTGIEVRCIAAWKELEEKLEQSIDYSVSDIHWALRRWSSNFLLHLGALKEGLSAWSREIDDFATLLTLMDKREGERTLDEKRKIREIESRIENLLNTSTTIRGTKAVKLSDNVTLSGQWVVEKLKPEATSTESSGSVSLGIQFKVGGSRGKEKAMLAALMYLWLSRRESGHLDERCFPQELLVGITDARVRAASRGEYAFENDDVELLVNTPNAGMFTLARFDGEVDVSHE